MSEDRVHKDIVKHLRFRAVAGIVPMHINNTPRGERHGKNLKQKGLLKGAPDMLYILLGGRVMWHEIKTDTGRLSPDQKRIHSILKSMGHEVMTTYGLNDALKQLTERGVIR